VSVSTARSPLCGAFDLIECLFGAQLLHLGPLRHRVGFARKAGAGGVRSLANPRTKEPKKQVWRMRHAQREEQPFASSWKVAPLARGQGQRASAGHSGPRLPREANHVIEHGSKARFNGVVPLFPRPCPEVRSFAHIKADITQRNQREGCKTKQPRRSTLVHASPGLRQVVPQDAASDTARRSSQLGRLCCMREVALV